MPNAREGIGEKSGDSNAFICQFGSKYQESETCFCSYPLTW